MHEHIKDVCRRFARADWHAVAPELFFRFGDPQTYPTTPQILSDLVPKVTDAQVMSDLDATLAFANTNGGDAANAGITGFCWAAGSCGCMPRTTRGSGPASPGTAG